MVQNGTIVAHLKHIKKLVSKEKLTERNAMSGIWL
jgi:hypothetical protein